MSLPTPPPSITVEEGDELVLTRRWISLDVLFLVGIAVFWNVFLALWFVSAADTPILWLFVSGHVLAGVGLVYATVCQLVNRTVIRVDRARVDVRHGPLPFARSRALDATQLRQLYVRAPRDNRSTWSGVPFAVSARGPDGAIDLLGVRTEEEARFIERAIETHLGIVDEPVSLDAAPVPRPASVVVLDGAPALERADAGYRSAARATGPTLRLRVSWRELDGLSELFFGGAMFALAFVATTVTGGTAGRVATVLFASVFVYRGLARLIEHSTVTLGAERLTVANGPLPIRRGVVLETGDVRAIEVRSTPGGPRTPDRHAVVAQLAAGARELVTARNLDEARHVAGLLATHLEKMRAR